MRGRLAPLLGAWLGVACGAPEPSTDVPVEQLRQAVVRTENCLDRVGNPLRVVATSHGAVGNGVVDDTAALQQTLDAAHAWAAQWPGECTVQAYLPAGVYRTTQTLFVSDRVHVLGKDVSQAAVIAEHDGSIFDIRELGKGCVQYANVRIQHVQMSYARDLAQQIQRGEPVGHCVRAASGVRNLELRNLALKDCGTYGIGLQLAHECDGAYEHVTIRKVHVASAGRDGIDIKQSKGGKINRDIEVFDVCVGDRIGQKAAKPGTANAALDLRGAGIDVLRFTYLGKVPELAGTRLHGIVLHSGSGVARDVTIVDSQIHTAHVGILFGGPDVRDVAIKDVRIESAQNGSTAPGIGILMRGTGHHLLGNVCVQQADHAKLIDEGGNGVALTACPTSGVAGGNNPVCSAPPFLELPPRRADPHEGSPR